MIENLQFSTEIPAIYHQLREKFGVDWDTGLIITYFPLIHCKFKLNEYPEKIMHEAVHIRQQEKMTPQTWWTLFLQDPSFRLEQEVEAYRAEAAFIKKVVKDRNAQAVFYNEIAKNLSGPIYGNMVNFSEALKLIKKVL